MKLEHLRRPYILFLAFLSGAGVMALEMAGARALSPHFGSSTYIWANIIGTLMASLALGYYFGGRLADRVPRLTVLLALFGASGVAAAIVPTVIHPLSRVLVPEGIAAEHSFRINVLGSLLVTVVLLAPLVFLLGMTPPFLVRLLARAREEAGSAAGRVNAFGAVGSIAGTFLPTLILIPACGTRLTFTLTGAFLAGAGAVGFSLFARGRVRLAAWALMIPLIPSAILGGRSVHPGPETLDERDSAYQFIRVYEKEGKRYLTLNEGRDQFHSLLVHGKFLTGGNYYDYLNLVPLHFEPRLKRRLRVCIVGLAAGIYSRQIHHFFDGLYRVEIDGAEIDPGVLDVGRLYFGLAGPENRNLEIAAADGRVFLETSRGNFDLIVIDAYSRQLYIPFHLVTEEFFRLCRQKLAPGGFVAVNVCDFGARSPALSAIRNTASRVFGTSHLIRLPGTLNYLLYARNEGRPADVQAVLVNLELPALASLEESEDLKKLILRTIHYRTDHREDPKGVVLTDDRAPVERLMDRSFRRVRRRIRLEEPEE